MDKGGVVNKAYWDFKKFFTKPFTVVPEVTKFLQEKTKKYCKG